MIETMFVGHDKFAMIDEQDADLKAFDWHVLSGRYVARRLSVKEGRKYVYLHQIIAERKYGIKTTDQIVADHKDGNIYNNTRDNIRLANRCESAYNRKGWGKSGLKGAYPSGSKWKSFITVNHERHYLGIFDTPEKAHEAYTQAASEQHKDFANLKHQNDCVECRGTGYTSIRNGDDDIPCDQCQLDADMRSIPY